MHTIQRDGRENDEEVKVVDHTIKEVDDRRKSTDECPKVIIVIEMVPCFKQNTQQSRSPGVSQFVNDHQYFIRSNTWWWILLPGRVRAVPL